MRRFAALLVGFALASLACGGGNDAAPAAPATTAAVSPSTTAAGASTSDGGADTATTVAAVDGGTTSAAPVENIDGPPAPDFTLALGRDAGTFTLSAEQKPVYMVFWAEW